MAKSVVAYRFLFGFPFTSPAFVALCRPFSASPSLSWSMLRRIKPGSFLLGTSCLRSNDLVMR